MDYFISMGNQLTESAELLASNLLSKMDFKGLCNFKIEVLEKILRLVDQENELINNASLASKGTVPLPKGRIREEKIKKLMLETSEKDLFLSVPELAERTDKYYISEKAFI